ncbi:MAG: porin family protein [Bacteroidales bacterium]
MKKIFLILGLVLISSIIYSQESKIAIGFQVSPAITSIRGIPTIETLDNRFVISPGITFDYNISRNFSFNSGLAFERKGAKMTYSWFSFSEDELVSQNFKTNFNYLTMPLMFTYNTNTKVNFFIGGGTFLGYLISQKDITEATADMLEHLQDNTNSFKRLDSGLSLITGVNMPVAPNLILDLGLRNYMGLVKINKYEIVNDGSIKTNSYSLVLGLKYAI